MSNTVQAKYNFTTHKEGDDTVFQYKKTPFNYKLTFSLPLITAIPSIVIVFMLEPSSFVMGFILWFVVMIVLGLIITFVINFLRTRNASEFRVGKSGIKIGNKTYDYQHIHSYLIQDTYGNESELTVTTTVGYAPSLVGAMSQTGNLARQSGREIRKIVADSNYKICMRYGTKNVAIAKGLGLNEAEVLFDKIREIILKDTNNQ
ncbi:hypothetical protein E6C50_01105 [Flavobacterium supellecticarium]|uniref:Uncharacterized protein n=1 Tax=Flavobacterium supellecticarium TaxID=2565924 RepID=A0A4S4A345_9FLAO|nr:hypothetical protein [Flavobacterium supellecticarium]THF52839.1 hypothetical protein E6C50_01105 [Flavobacterium supellecticarium]